MTTNNNRPGKGAADGDPIKEFSSARIPAVPPIGPEAHKELARRLGIRYASAEELYVLSSSNDPFYKGRPSDYRDAEWFTEIWEQFGYESGVHLRRVHYQILSNDLRAADGTAYLNTEKYWGKLCAAGAAARILGMVDVEAFDDRRNPDPVINHPERETWRTLEPYVSFWQPSLELPELDLSGFENVRLNIGAPYAYGYTYSEADQPVMIEIWVEKSTMGDILIPLCRSQNLNYVEGAGFESITQTVAFLRRAQQNDKPAHIIYISDFDPGGDAMPVAVARQLQFWLIKLGIEVDVSVDTTALTLEQCVEYELPRMPIKEKDLRRGNFETRYGAGATELDALEALHPGEFETIIRHAITPYVDQGLARRMARASMEADQRVKDAWTDSAGEEVEQAARELSDHVSAVAAEQAERIREMVQESLSHLEQFNDAADQLKERAEAIAAGLEIDLPERPEPVITGPLADVMFDSRRHWYDQLAVFKTRKNGDEDEDE